MFDEQQHEFLKQLEEQAAGYLAQSSPQQQQQQPEELPELFQLTNEDFLLSDEELEILEYKPAHPDHDDAYGDVKQEADDDECQIVYEVAGDPFDFSTVKVKTEPADD